MQIYLTLDYSENVPACIAITLRSSFILMNETYIQSFCGLGTVPNHLSSEIFCSNSYLLA